MYIQTKSRHNFLQKRLQKRQGSRRCMDIFLVNEKASDLKLSVNVIIGGFLLQSVKWRMQDPLSPLYSTS